MKKAQSKDSIRERDGNPAEQNGLEMIDTSTVNIMNLARLMGREIAKIGDEYFCLCPICGVSGYDESSAWEHSHDCFMDGLGGRIVINESLFTSDQQSFECNKCCISGGVIDFAVYCLISEYIGESNCFLEERLAELFIQNFNFKSICTLLESGNDYMAGTLSLGLTGSKKSVEWMLRRGLKTILERHIQKIAGDPNPL